MHALFLVRQTLLLGRMPIKIVFFDPTLVWLIVSCSAATIVEPGRSSSGRSVITPGQSAPPWGRGTVGLYVEQEELARMRRLIIVSSTIAAIVALAVSVFALGVAPRAGAVPSATGTGVSTGTYYGVSQPVRDLPSSATAFHGSPDRPLRSPGQAAGSQLPDPIAQTIAGPQVSVTNGVNMNGIGDTSNTPANPCNCAPPDTNGAVGGNLPNGTAGQYVQIVNTAFGVYSKSTGALVSGPTAINSLWAGFGGGCQSNNDGDPVVQYDQQANVWIITQFSVSTTPYLQCVAVSTSSDATGTYHLYSFNYGNTAFPDYPKLGVWSNAYLITFNIFNNGQTFAGPMVCAWDRSAMIAGTAPTQLCHQFGTSVNSILTADIDGSNLPTAGEAVPAVSLGSNALNYYTFSPNFTAGTLGVTGPTSIPVASFSQACSGGTCIPQPGTNNQLDSLADRLMYRLAYRKYNNGTESLVVTHSVRVSGSKRSQVDGIRWYELRNPSAGTPTLFQQGTFSPDSNSCRQEQQSASAIRVCRRGGGRCYRTCMNRLIVACPL